LSLIDKGHPASSVDPSNPWVLRPNIEIEAGLFGGSPPPTDKVILKPFLYDEEITQELGIKVGAVESYKWRLKKKNCYRGSSFPITVQNIFRSL